MTDAIPTIAPWIKPNWMHPGRRKGGPNVPRYAVWHDTDTALGTSKTILRAWAEEPGQGNGAHFLITEDGTVYQLAKLTENGNHAGGPDHGTINGHHPNTDTVGIEIINPGISRTQQSGYINVQRAEPGLVGWWLPYRRSQEEAAQRLMQELAPLLRPNLPPGELQDVVIERPVDRPNLRKIVSCHPWAIRHYDINPIQKTDPGPLLPVLGFAKSSEAMMELHSKK